VQIRFKTSYRGKPTPPRYQELIKEVEGFSKDVSFRWSIDGVPHLLVELGRGIVYSLCYFKSGKNWRVFFPYGTGDQQKKDFYDTDSMVKFLKRHQPRGRMVPANA